MNFTLSPIRQLLSPRLQAGRAEFERLATSPALVRDEGRRRPLWFDGRFLTAADLTREQDYVRLRQADFGRAVGAGIVHGLEVQLARDPAGGLRGAARLAIMAGHGIAPNGEPVVLPVNVEIDLADVAAIERLDATFGLRRRPGPPVGTQTGLFILSLRPVEYTANPTASYPTSITEKRTVEDGDVIEGVAVTLTPWPDGGGEEVLGRRRSRAARSIFVEGNARGIPVDALPVAMVALDRGSLRWLDMHMMRRELGADRADLFGDDNDRGRRAAREAYLLQYEGQLATVVDDRNGDGHFAAGDYFDALPPIGQLPAATITTSATDFTQSFFPAQVDVELTIIPEDELPALVEESLHLPPIDLTLESQALDNVGVLLLVPVPRARVRELRGALSQLTRSLRPAAPGLIAQRRPLEALRTIRFARLPVPVPPQRPAEDAQWAQLVTSAMRTATTPGTGGRGLIWYVRRRDVSRRADISATTVRVFGNEAAAEQLMNERLVALGLADAVNELRTGTSTLAVAEIVLLLSSARFVDKQAPASELLVRAAVDELRAARASDEAPAGALDRRKVLAVHARFADTDLGEGLTRLAAQAPELTTEQQAVNGLVGSRNVPEIDRAGRRIDDAQVVTFARDLLAAARAGDTPKIIDLLASVAPA